MTPANVRQFEAGLAKRQFLIPWCTRCGRYHFYPRFACPHCWGDEFDWRPAGGRGVIYSLTVVRANPPSSFIERLPYAIAIIDLDEGVRTMANLAGGIGAAEIGSRVSLAFSEVDGVTVPVFRVET